MAHTPGNWRVHTKPDKNDGHFSVFTDAYGHLLICDLFSERKADDACLIAASPDLLAALEKSVPFVAKYANDHESKIAFRMLAQMHAAIDKATKG